MQEGLKFFYWVVLAFSCLASAISFKWIDKPGRIISLLVGLSVITEVLASSAKYRLMNNLMIYDHFSVLEFLLLCIYFNFTIDVLGKRSLGIILGIVGSIIGLLGIHLKLFPFYNFLFAETIIMVFMSFLFYFRLLLKNNGENLLFNPHFGFISAILFYWLVSFLNWGMYDYLTSHFKEEIPVIHNILLTINIITYLIFTSVFLFYLRSRKNHAR